MYKVMDIAKLNEFNVLKGDVAEVWQQSQSLDSEKRRLVNLTEYLWICNCFIILKCKYRTKKCIKLSVVNHP